MLRFLSVQCKTAHYGFSLLAQCLAIVASNFASELAVVATTYGLVSGVETDMAPYKVEEGLAYSLGLH